MSYLIESPDGTERNLVPSLDGYEGWTVLDPDAPEEIEFKIWDGQALVDDVPAAEAWALDRLERDAEEATGNEVSRLRRQVAITFLWHEVQRLKLANSTGNVPADLTERRKQFPTLMALVALSGKTLTQVATAAENRLWDQVRRMALWEAKLMMAEDNVKIKATVAEKIAASEVSWVE